MDLTDILFSKPFISSSSGGSDGSNIETATIVFTVTGENGAATVTSGEIPDWCTPANSDNIYGNVIINGATEHGTFENCDGKVIGVRIFANSPYEIWALEGIYGMSSGRSIPFVTLDSTYMLMGEEINNLPFLSGSLTFNLIYMPN